MSVFLWSQKENKEKSVNSFTKETTDPQIVINPYYLLFLRF